jgi:hypothetical protein
MAFACATRHGKVPSSALRHLSTLVLVRCRNLQHSERVRQAGQAPGAEEPDQEQQRGRQERPAGAEALADADGPQVAQTVVFGPTSAPHSRAARCHRPGDRRRHRARAAPRCSAPASCPSDPRRPRRYEAPRAGPRGDRANARRGGSCAVRRPDTGCDPPAAPPASAPRWRGSPTRSSRDTASARRRVGRRARAAPRRPASAAADPAPGHDAAARPSPAPRRRRHLSSDSARPKPGSNASRR